MKKLLLMVGVLFVVLPVSAANNAAVADLCKWALSHGLAGSESSITACGKVGVTLAPKPEGAASLDLTSAEELKAMAQAAMDKLKDLWDKYMSLNIGDLQEKSRAIRNKLWEDNNLQQDINSWSDILEDLLDYIASVEENYGLADVKKGMEERLRELAGIEGLEKEKANLQNEIDKYEKEAKEVEEKDPKYAAELRQKANELRDKQKAVEQNIEEAMEKAREAAKTDETYQKLEEECNWINEQVIVGSGGGYDRVNEITAQLNSLREQALTEEERANLQAEYDKLEKEINNLYNESGVGNIEQVAYDTIQAYQKAGLCKGEEACMRLIEQELGIDKDQDQDKKKTKTKSN